MFGNHFYHAAIRRTVAVFGTLFNDINVLRKGSDGSAKSIVKVPLAYGPKQKFLARLDQQKELDDPKIALKLPRMSFELTSLAYNPNTKLQKGIKQSFPDPLDNNRMKTVLGPVGYNLGVQLNIMAKNQDDALQILEQILPYFQPDYTVTIKEVDNTFRSDQPFVLQSVGLADDYEGDFATRRVIIYTLDFETKVNFYGGIGSQGLVKSVNIDYNNVVSASKKPIERQSVAVNPLTAKETDAHTIVETIFQPNDPDRVVFTIPNAGTVFTVGETISANNSGATAVLVSQVATILTCKNVNGIFNTTDTLSGGTSGTTSAVTLIEELWND
jgi:hypothetical protein|tara:strand:- start:547 stop:1533 length:987 start_codon:yes stop_codon:yes gene_type:complete